MMTTEEWNDKPAGGQDDYTALRARLDAVENERDEADELQKATWADMVSNNVRLAETAHRAERSEAALATARRDALQSIASMKPTREQLSSAALSYDHSLGLMTSDQQEHLMHCAGFWLNAWQHEFRALAAQEGEE